MRIESLTAGTVELKEEQIYTFKQGIPGFEEMTQYALLNLGEGLPFALLQSMQVPELALVLTNPYYFYPDYKWDLPPGVQEELELADEGDLLVFAVVTVATPLAHSTLNLLAPIVINDKQKCGKQVILPSSPYTTRHPMQRRAQENEDCAGEEAYASVIEEEG